MKLTTYKIKRDYDNNTGFFFINVGSGFEGLGFQLRVGPHVFGCSVCWGSAR